MYRERSRIGLSGLDFEGNMATTSWAGKTAVVCGASAGLGRQFAVELADQGVARLALVARTLEPLHALRDELHGLHPSVDVRCIVVDLCDKHALQFAADELGRVWGQFDLLVQAVGQSDRGRLLDLTSSRLDALLSANLRTSLHAIQCFAPLMATAQGTIVLIGSLACKFAPRFLGGYAITKHALAGLAQQARLELAEQGLHVLLACPGPIARVDAGLRYSQKSGGVDVPHAALQPGGGAKLHGLDGAKLVKDILAAAGRRAPEIIRPRKAILLVWLSSLSQRLGDRVLRSKSS